MSLVWIICLVISPMLFAICFMVLLIPLVAIVGSVISEGCLPLRWYSEVTLAEMMED